MKRDAKHAACEGAEEILWAKYKARGAEITRLRGEILFKDDAINGLHGAYSTAADEIARLRKAICWGARTGVKVTEWSSLAAEELSFTIDLPSGARVQFAGDDASMIETLCRLAEGE